MMEPRKATAKHNHMESVQEVKEEILQISRQDLQAQTKKAVDIALKEPSGGRSRR